MTRLKDVVIVGGGPVGLWAACELALAGVSVALLERRTRRIGQSRGLTIHGRTIEMLSLRGIEDRFLKIGKPIKQGHLAVLDTRLDFDFIASRFPYTLFLPQDTTEAIVEERAVELGVEFYRGAQVEAVEIGDDGVRVRAVQDGEPIAISGRYLIGADGARSIVRQAAGIPFEGYPATGMWFMGDVVLDRPPEVPVLSRFNAEGCAMAAPLGDGKHWRIVLNESEDRGMTRADPVTMDELQTVTKKIVGTDFGARDPLWLSRFDNETRLAAQYRERRVFLAGDAAHIHLPAGGQGMNVGMQDAMNLAWKLAMVVKGEAPESLLDSYETERRPIGEYLHRTTMAQSHLITAFSPHGQALREVMNDLLKRVPEANRYFAMQVSGFGVHYSEPLLGGGRESRHALDGHRLRDFELTLGSGEATTLYALLSEGRWLGLSLKQGSEAPLPSWVADTAITRAEASLAELMPELEGVSALAVRPDGYVARAIGG